MLDVVVLLLGGNYASTSVAPLEVFHAAGRLSHELDGTTPAPAFRVRSASLDGGPVDTLYGLKLLPDCDLTAITRADVVMVPASGFDLDGYFEKNAALLPWLREQHASGAYLAGVCSGVAYLAEAGLLRGRHATTHWGLASLFAERYPDVRWHPDSMVAEDGRLLTCGGVYASTDLALYLVERLCGRTSALACARSLVLDMPRAHQSGYAMLPLSRPHVDARIRDAESYIERHFAEPLPVATLAAHANMSPRTFMRRFKAATGRQPGEYLQALRVRIACEMLEAGSDAIQAVGEAVGYTDGAYFRILFKRHTGMTPAAYRARFAGAFAA